MKIAQLQLNKYSVTEYSYKLNLSPKKAKESTYEIEVDFDVKGHKTDPDKYLMIMTINLNKRPVFFKSNRYKIFMRLLGEFGFAKGMEREIKTRLIFNNGSAMLYGVARGAVAQFTGGLGAERFILPAVNLLDVVKEKAKKFSSAPKTK